MLHPRYHNYLSCFYHIFKEEGIRGYYKGYLPYLIAQAFVFLTVPYLAE